MNSFLACNDLTVRFYEQPKPVLNQISLTIQKGEKVLILGPSGSGKSTLISVLAGIIPEHVEADMQGEVVLQRHTGVMFQDPDSQFCMHRVNEEIAFSLENRSVPREEMDDIIQQLMQKVQLNVDPHTEIHTLSGGMKQRLALACLLALQPDVLFFDEPTAQLDPAGRMDIFQLLQQLAADQQQTMIFVEHVLDGVIEWMDRVILLDDQGCILADGAPKGVLVTYEEEMKEAGIWRPKLFPEKWSTIIQDPFHPLSQTFMQTYEARKAKHEKVPSFERETMIRTENLQLSYGKKRIMSNLQLDIKAGDWVAIIGENGSGKSTFLKHLIRLEPAKKGHIFLKETDLKKWSDRLLYEKAGFVFQNPELQFIQDTVFDEIAFGGRQRNWPESVVQEKTAQLLKEFGLEKHAKAHPFTLSLGQKRRLSVATMLLFDQDVLLLDEPTFGQDEKTAKELMRRLKERQCQGTTIVMVTHDMELVDECADQVLLFHQGKHVYDGTPYDLFSNQELVDAYQLRAPLHYRYVAERKDVLTIAK
ncbi:energy-coupling factor transporter ATPase [Bacillus safensis]|uniref:ABC transporter ATP-binding protein n=1 Tax=Bacillus safensis TaxID=561879 RepID=UPI00227F75F6|nr:ABC transporter ATP-binding protein [Bacillus safensis]MCY7708161.1 energy-coupling factor transporter ATPase [Bacillus safensis]MCY7728764.1 energy-coupling factor transporter ATPase [Bacillus safensis]MED0882384.1 energy-coupling factor transporter ATPase [Bacillus safensis]MED0917670.1 energy-coupling factor transporter ATPase [Bacillus safensis]